MRTFYIAVKFRHRYDLSPSSIVTELTCHRSNCHRSGLSPIRPVSIGHIRGETECTPLPPA